MSEKRLGSEFLSKVAALGGVQSIEHCALALVGAAGGLYIVRCLPSILFPQGILLTLSMLLLGAVLGMLGFTAAVVYAVCALSNPSSGSALPGAASPASHQSAQPAHASRSHRRGTPPVTVPGSVPPPAFCRLGELSGVVYTIPLSRFAREDTITEWPPAISGPQAYAKKWRATLSQGTLVLHPVLEPVGPQKAATGALSPQAASTPNVPEGLGENNSTAGAVGGGGSDSVGNGESNGEEGAAPLANPRKVGILLEGCSVKVVREGLKGRSRWIRRAPLLVAHPRWNLLDGERGFYLLAEDPASKQQWYHALSWWCEGGGERRGAAIELLYDAYCGFMAEHTMLEYPQEEEAWEACNGAGQDGGAQDNGSSGSGSVLGGDGATARVGAAGRGSWKAWGAQKMQSVKKKVSDRRRGNRVDEAAQALPVPAPDASAHPGHQGPPPVLPSSPASAPDVARQPVTAEQARSAGDPQLSSLESFIDARWMHSTKIPVPSTVHQAVSNPTSPSRLPRRSASASEQTSLAGGDDAQSLVGGSGYATPLLGSSPQRPPLHTSPLPRSGLGLSPSKPPMQEQGQQEQQQQWARQQQEGAAAGASQTPGKGDSRREVGAVVRPVPGQGLHLPASLPGTPFRGGRTGPQQRAMQELVQAQGGRGGVGGRRAATDGLQRVSSSSAASTLGEQAQEQRSRRNHPAAAAVGEGAPQGGDVAERQGPGRGRGREAVLLEEGEEAKGVAPSEPPGAGVPPGLPPLLAADYAANMFLTRAGFDLLRNPAVHDMVTQRIRRRVALLSTPDYVQSLEVIDVSLGSSVPTVRSFAALPTPDNAVWPQMVFDLYYQGSFTISLEAKVDIRDAAAWGHFDRAMSKLEGRGGGGMGPRDDANPGGASPRMASPPPLSPLAGDGAEASIDDEEGEAWLERDSPQASAAARGEGPAGGGAESKVGGRQFMSKLRATAGRKLRQLAETTADRISKLPLRVSLTFSVLEGTMMAWVPPPPGNRLFISFLRTPHLVVKATPEVGGRLLKYRYATARVSSWIEMRMRAALTKNMVFPGGTDFVLPGLMDLDDPHVADTLPGLPATPTAGASPPPGPARGGPGPRPAPASSPGAGHQHDAQGDLGGEGGGGVGGSTQEGGWPQMQQEGLRRRLHSMGNGQEGFEVGVGVGGKQGQGVGGGAMGGGSTSHGIRAAEQVPPDTSSAPPPADPPLHAPPFPDLGPAAPPPPSPSCPLAMEAGQARSRPSTVSGKRVPGVLLPELQRPTSQPPAQSQAPGALGEGGGEGRGGIDSDTTGVTVQPHDMPPHVENPPSPAAHDSVGFCDEGDLCSGASGRSSHSSVGSLSGRQRERQEEEEGESTACDGSDPEENSLAGAEHVLGAAGPGMEEGESSAPAAEARGEAPAPRGRGRLLSATPVVRDLGGLEERGHLVGGGPAGRVGPSGCDTLQQQGPGSAPSTPGGTRQPLGTSSTGRFVSRGLSYLRQQAQQQHSPTGAAQHEGNVYGWSRGGEGEGVPTGSGTRRLTAQGKRVAGLMLNRWSQAGIAWAQQMQQGRQQRGPGEGGSEAGAGGGAQPPLRRMHSD